MLQKNYWSMVKSQLPMWEKDIGMSRPSTSRSEPAQMTQTGPTTQNLTGDSSARSQPTEKVKGITPRKKKKKLRSPFSKS